jgi:hypothetical protein
MPGYGNSLCAMTDARSSVTSSGVYGFATAPAGVTGGVVSNSPITPTIISMMSAMPSLTAPAGITLSRVGRFSGSGGGVESYARASGKLGASELLQKFSEQLQQVGWKAHPASASESSTLQSLELRDGRGKVYAGVLAVTQIGNTEDRDVLFRMVDVSP